MIVADASPLIFLARLQRLRLLNELWGEVLLPEEVAEEVIGDLARPGASAVAEAIRSGAFEVRPVEPSVTVEGLRRVVDSGEAAAIGLALQLGQAGIVMDDGRGRRVAEDMGLTPIGTVGVLLRAHAEGRIATMEAPLEALEDLGFRLGGRVREAILAQARKAREAADRDR